MAVYGLMPLTRPRSGRRESSGLLGPGAWAASAPPRPPPCRAASFSLSPQGSYVDSLGLMLALPLHSMALAQATEPFYTSVLSSLNSILSLLLWSRACDGELDSFGLLRKSSQEKGKEGSKIGQGKDVVSAGVYGPSEFMGVLKNKLQYKVGPNLRQRTGLCTPALAGCRLPLWEAETGSFWKSGSHLVKCSWGEGNISEALAAMPPSRKGSQGRPPKAS